MFWPSTKHLLFYTKNYSIVPDYLSFTQAHTIFGLHAGPNNYVSLDNGLIQYQCEKKKKSIDWCHFAAPYNTHSTTSTVAGDNGEITLLKSFLQL